MDRLPQDTIDALLSDGATGDYTLTALAEKHGTRPATACKYLKRAGISIVDAKRQKREEKKKKLKKQGRDKIETSLDKYTHLTAQAKTGMYTLNELAEPYGVTGQSVSDLLERRGIPSIVPYQEAYQTQLDAARGQLLSLLRVLYQQRYAETIAEKGEAYGLAWRMQYEQGIGKKFGGKDLSTDQFARLIEARRAGKSYSGCILDAGLREPTDSYHKGFSQARHILLATFAYAGLEQRTNLMPDTNNA